MPKNYKRLIAAVSVAAAASAVIATTAAASTAPQAAAVTTLSLQARGGTFTSVNVTHATSFPEVGDELMVSQPVYQAAHPKQLAGHLYLIITFVAKAMPPAGTYQQATLVLKHGEILAAGMGSSSLVAVTGGTGSYDNARGQARTRVLPGPGNRTDITVTLLR
jgi:hypothetical protein